MVTSASLKPVNETFRDGENNPIHTDAVYRIRHNELETTLQQIFALHGENTRLLPLSGTSAGGGVFQFDRADSSPVVGLQFLCPAQPRVTHKSSADLRNLRVDEIVIDKDRRQVSAGAGITLGQLNQALADELGSDFRVLGADLTSYSYAQVGSTFMTGGMGPQRRYFSDSVIEVSLHNGVQLQTVSGEKLKGFSGTYGWSGLVSAVKCQYNRLPPNEIAFALPVANSATGLATMLSGLSRFCFLDVSTDLVQTTQGSTSILLGIEHLTTQSMQPLIDSGSNPTQVKQALRLVDKCKQAAVDGLVFISGFSELEVDEFLMELVETRKDGSMAIGDVNAEFAEMFSNPEDMREFRESVSFAARTVEPKGEFVYKSHTDANIRINKDSVYTSMSKLWQCSTDFVGAVEHYLGSLPDVQGSVLVYGHLNPYGVDPHNRVTFSCNDEALFIQAKSVIEDLRAEFYRNINEVCIQTHSEFIGGEKSADSEQKIYSSFDSLESVPANLQDRLHHQKRAIQAAAPSLRWRAFPAYR